MLWTIFLFTTIFLFGIVIGSFVNVCIYRIPKKEDIVRVRSHCMNCGYQLKWYDLVPLFSYLALRGRCRKCSQKLSVQYPIVEAANGKLNVESLLYCLLASALVALSVIDFRTYEIPVGINLFILTIGLIRVVTDLSGWLSYLIGFFSVSVFLMILYYATKGRSIGGGDVKLMAVCGLVLGWKLIVLAFFIGCVLGAVIHVVRMRVSGESHVLAMGPYLSMGVFLSMLWGNTIIEWYLQFL